MIAAWAYALGAALALAREGWGGPTWALHLGIAFLVWRVESLEYRRSVTP